MPIRLGWHCQSKIYTGVSGRRAKSVFTVFAGESAIRSVRFAAEKRLYSVTLTMPVQGVPCLPNSARVSAFRVATPQGPYAAAGRHPRTPQGKAGQVPKRPTAARAGSCDWATALIPVRSSPASLASSPAISTSRSMVCRQKQSKQVSRPAAYTLRGYIINLRQTRTPRRPRSRRPLQRSAAAHVTALQRTPAACAAVAP
jgi:hypothetical protein